MRLIDADEVKETIRHRTKLVEWQKGIIWALIDMHKTVDAVPVIRCKECKYSSPNGVYGCRIESFADDLDERMYSNDYCSCAVRKEE